jgi:hypothetical protein
LFDDTDDFVAYSCETVSDFVFEYIDALDKEGPSVIDTLNDFKPLIIPLVVY